MQEKRQSLRTIVRGAYDLQKLRISTGNRVVGNFRAKLGQKPGERTDTLDAEAQAMLVDLKNRYKRIADALAEKPRTKREFPGDEVISSYTDFALVAQYVELDKVEADHFRRIERALKEFEIYNTYLSKVKGIGPAMAGVILSEFDIYAAKYPSTMHAYAGLDVALKVDGLGRSKRKEHLVKRQYKNAKGEEAERDSITYNPWLKTKLLGVLGPSFLRSASPWADLYYNYRHRIESDPNRIITDKPGFHKDNTWTPMRRHQAAIRYMVKMFLNELYNKWRAIEGLEIAPTYQEAKLGHVHSV